jgi:hypothetical protein
METTESRELTRLRRAVAEHARGRDKRYRRHLRERVARWARDRVSAGESIRHVAAELGMRFETVRRWAAAVVLPTARLLPVRVIDELPAAERTLTIIAPSGHRIEGLLLVEVVTILRALG